MKPVNYIFVVILVAFFCPNLSAQPFSLDEKIKPVKLELIDDEKVEGASGIITNATLNNEPHYWFTKVDMFRPVDIYVFSNYDDEDFKVEIANTNWEDIADTQNTGSAENGIIHFQIRTEGDFGIHVYPGRKKINYTLVIYANPPVKEFLGSVFRKARPDELKESADNGEAVTSSEGTGDDRGSENTGGSNNMVLYVILGVALLVIGFLLAMVLNKRKAAGIFILFFLGTLQPAIAQMHDGNVWGPDSMDQYKDWLGSPSGGGDGWGSLGDVNTGLKRLGSLGSGVSKGLGTYGAAKGAFDAYQGLNSCMNSTPPPSMPRIPSFCESDDCERCFVDARQRFNENRYTFERLKTIYTCTKTFTDRMIAFGDNVSGYHGVSGLAWQSEKIKVLKSVEQLKKTYDEKFAELIQSQQEILMELNECEAAHGIPDWYDRFGYLFFEFTKMHYARKD